MLGQTYQVIHTFSGGGDGATPDAGLTPDGHGNYYGTAYSGGAHDAGTVFKITPHGSSWVLSTLYSFTGSADGGWPTTGVTLVLTALCTAPAPMAPQCTTFALLRLARPAYWRGGRRGRYTSSRGSRMDSILAGTSSLTTQEIYMAPWKLVARVVMRDAG